LGNDPQRAKYVLAKIQELYKVERIAREGGLTFEARKELRVKGSSPVMGELEAWMRENLTQVLPKSHIGQAIAYSISMWGRLKRYLEDGRYEIDNNRVENSIRPVALGRKNYLFAGSHEGAERAAMVYSFIGTCKFNHVNPSDWLYDIITRIPQHKANRLEELLPHNWKNNLPQNPSGAQALNNHA
jgi:transposase